MRKWLVLAGVLSVLAVAANRAAAADDDKEARAVIEKAIKAEGGMDKLSKIKAWRGKAKGTIRAEGATIEFTMTQTVKLPSAIKTVIEFEFMGRKGKIVSVTNKDKAWMQAPTGGTEELTGDKLKKAQDDVYNEKVGLLVPLLKDKEFKLSSLGEEKVNGKAALGVKVSSKGHKDIKLYFDKETNLLVKRSVKTTTDDGKEVQEETLYSNYKTFGGIKQPTKMSVKHDGKKFIDGEVTDWKALDKVEESEFAKPGSET